MEAFGDEYLVHNLPLLLLSGIEHGQHSQRDASSRTKPLLHHEGGFRVRTDLPPLSTDHAADLLEAFLTQDGSQLPWKAQQPTTTQAKWFRMSCTGRVGRNPS